jgi:hypothetical protein
VLGIRNPQSIACEVWSLCFPGFCCKSLIIYFLYVILFLLFTNDVYICMELDPGVHIGITWFVLKTGCDKSHQEAPAFAGSYGYRCKGSGATVGDNHKGPLITGEIAPFRN